MEARIGQLLEHARWVRGLARCLTHDEASADDLAQDAWVAALRSPPAVAEDARGWFGAVVRNSRRMELRGARRRQAREDASIDPDARVESTADVADEVELGRILAEELLQLAEPYRETLLLTFYRDLSSMQIAAQRGVPAATVRTHVKVGLERLRAALDRRYGERKTWKHALAPLAALPIGQVVAPLKGTLVTKIVFGLFATTAIVGGASRAWHRPAPMSTTVATLTTVAAPTKPIHQLAELKAQRDRLVSQMVARRPQHTPPPAASSPTTASGSLDPEYVRQAVADLLPLFQECLQAGLVDDPDMTGKLLLRFTISADPELGGVVSDSSVDPSSTITMPSVRECFEQTIYAARLPAPTNGGDVVTEFPFVLLEAPDAGD